jgi:hypothetical protein
METYKYDETAEAGIKNVWCGHLKLDKGYQSVVKSLKTRKSA